MRTTNIALFLAYCLITVAATFAGAGIGGAGVLIWNGIATIAGWYVGSVIQGAMVLGGFAFVTTASLCILSATDAKETKGDDE